MAKRRAKSAQTVRTLSRKRNNSIIVHKHTKTSVGCQPADVSFIIIAGGVRPLNTLQAVFLDLDGTLYNGQYKIEYAERLIQRLRHAGIPFLFLTNNSSRTPQMVAEHLCELGIEAKPGEVYNSAQAAATYVIEQGTVVYPPRVYCIGEIGMRTALLDAGAKLISEEDTHTPDFVVQGIDRQLTYDKLKRAVQHILNGATFILTNPDLLLPWNQQFVPGAGSIGAMLEAATGVKPVVIGKPSAIIMRYALAKMSASSFDEVLMIGDNLRTDIAAAHAVGCRSALVLTGVAQAHNVDALIATSGVMPDAIYPDLKSLADEWLQPESPRGV
jgi:4-nitrophenyl phosphatase